MYRGPTRLVRHPPPFFSLLFDPRTDSLSLTISQPRGQPLPPTVPHKPHVLLLADCVYLEVAFQPLVDTMADLSTPDTEILFCYQKRRKVRFLKSLTLDPSTAFQASKLTLEIALLPGG